MGKLGEEVSQKIKSAIRAKLMELGIHMDNELPDYVMVLVANKKSQKQMENDLQLFLGPSTVAFTTWLHSVLKKLEQVTVSPRVLKKKTDDKKEKGKRSTTDDESEDKGTKKLKTVDSTNVEDKSEKSAELDMSEDEANSKPIEESVRKESSENSEVEDDDYLNLREETESLCEERESADFITKESEYTEEVAENKEESASKTNKMDVKENKEKQKDEGEGREKTSPKERVKIIWDERDDGGKKRNPTEKQRTKDKETGLRLDRESLKSANRTTLGNEKDKQTYSNSDTKESMVGKKITDAREILNQKASVSKNIGEREAEKAGKSEDRERKWKHLPSISKVVVNERNSPKAPEVTIPSLVKVTPRPIRRGGIQANKNLILKAVADAEKSVATVKNVTKTREILKEKKSDWKKFSEYIPPAKISITLPNNRVPSSREVDKSHEEEELNFDENEDDIKNKDADEDIIFEEENQITKTEQVEEDIVKTPSEKCDDFEPEFVITLDGHTSKMYSETWDREEKLDDELNEKPDKTEEAYETTEPSQGTAFSKEPFNRSRLGPRPVVVAVKPLQKSSQDKAATKKEITFTETPEKVVESKTLERCKFWPNCRARHTCLYHHPETMCKVFPNCKYGEKCIYIHPACKFGERCLNINCPYWHTTTKGKTLLPLSVPRSQQCIYYPNCTNITCQFHHPNKRVCKFGLKCTNWGCEFDHSQTSLPTKDQLKWTSKN